MAGVISEIVGWASSKLKYWEQLALYKIMAGEELNDQDFKDLLHHLLVDTALIPDESDRADINFEAFEKQADQTISSSPQLCQIKNFQNVNALASEQCLPFGPQLTVVFGANGSGKSGYSRVLGCAGFMRGEVDVFPNINNPDCSKLTPQVDIEIKDDSGKRCVSYYPGQVCVELGSLHVFDVKSVQEHLVKKNTFTFSPAGLSYLTRLAGVTDIVRERLSDLVATRGKPHDFTPLFQGGDSPIKSIVAGLNAKTDLDALKKASDLIEEDKKRITDLDKRIAELKTKTVLKQITDLEKTQTDLNELRNKLETLSGNLADKVVTNVCEGINEFNTANSLAKQLGIDQFKTEFFSQTGSKEWYTFVKAAKNLAKAEQNDDKSYPQDGDRCLLCHQPLTNEAIALIKKLWQFLEGEAQSAVDKATRNLNTYKQHLDDLILDFFNDQSVSYRYLEKYDQTNKTEYAKTITKFVGECKKRVNTLAKMIEGKDSKTKIISLPENESTQIETISNNIDTKLDELRKSDPAKEIEKLQTELRNLYHKKILSEQYPEIQKDIIRLRWAEAASKAGGSTRHITMKYNALFEQIVTGGYLNLFQDILGHLGRPIQVKVVTTSRKGSTIRQLVLGTESKSLPPGATPDTVLSEGEKRAVALADFLTEVALDTSSGGIVLDDPVTSLDLEWSAVIASLLAQEAQKRQVVVFTHNLPFVHYLKNYSNDLQVDVQMHWIKRGENDDQPGYVFANNSPALESSYKSTHIANEHYKKAKDLPPSDQEKVLKQGFGALRTTYESFIIYTLLGGVVIRWDERISPGRLKDIVWDKDIFQKVIDKHESLSRYIEGHLHSDAFVPIKPTPELLLQEIQEFDDIKKQHKQLKKTLV